MFDLTLSFDDPNISTLTVEEVADQMLNNKLANGEYIGDCRLEYGDLYADVHIRDEDVRLDGHLDRTETITLADIRDTFVASDYYTWAKDEDGNDVLVCFGC